VTRTSKAYGLWLNHLKLRQKEHRLTWRRKPLKSLETESTMARSTRSRGKPKAANDIASLALRAC
jgi:hypothetical protein